MSRSHVVPDCWCEADHSLVSRPTDVGPMPMDGDFERRTWGDGATRQYQHAIDEISYALDYIRCTCGVRLVEIRDGLAWYRHKAAVGEPIARPVVDRGGAPE